MNTEIDEIEALQDDAKLALPIYIAVDHSYSMKENDAIDAANALIPAIIDTCIKNPLADERARFCVIGFNDHAAVVSPLARGTNLAYHTFEASRGTNFSEVFTLLKSQIESDSRTLKADGYRSYRPAVFLITDGEPLDNPTAAFAALTDPNFSRHPNVSVFGVGAKVTPALVQRYTAHRGRSFVTSGGATAADALEEFIEILMLSVVSSIANSHGAHAGEADSGFVYVEDAIQDAEFMHELES